MTSFTTSESTVSFSQRAGQRERIEAEIIYVPGYALGGHRDGLVGLVGENGVPSVTGNAQPMLHIVFDFRVRERRQALHNRHPLAQLGQAGAGQLLRQCRLSGKNNVHQLGLRGLKIGEQAQRFQHLGFEVLRFVNHHDQAMAFLGDLRPDAC